MNKYDPFAKELHVAIYTIAFGYIARRKSYAWENCTPFFPTSKQNDCVIPVHRNERYSHASFTIDKVVLKQQKNIWKCSKINEGEKLRRSRKNIKLESEMKTMEILTNAFSFSLHLQCMKILFSLDYRYSWKLFDRK